MSKELTPPSMGPKVVILDAFADDLVGLLSGGMRGLRREPLGIDGVIAELAAVMPLLGSMAALSTEVYASVTQRNDSLSSLRSARFVVDKMVDVLKVSELWYEVRR